MSSGARPGIRERFFPMIWGLLYPLRCYLRYFPFHRGKGILLRNILTPLLPPPHVAFDLRVPGNARVSLRYRETLGWSSLLYGTFEQAELSFVSRYLRPGELAMDIGANVGIFSVVMGKAVGLAGRVFAFEPVPSNCARLEGNLEKNGLENVQVFPMALGASSGELMLRMAKDAAYHSLGEVERGFRDDAEMLVQVRNLDGVWEELGCPDIALLKMDVEGAEPAVLHGATAMLQHCMPVMLIEANTTERLRTLDEILGKLGYQYLHPKGFVAHNYLFYPQASIDDFRAAL